MLGNVQGYHLLILLGIVVLIVVIAVVVILSARRKSVRQGGTRQGSPANRIEQLTQLRDQGLVSEAEFEAKRRDILGEL